MKLSFCTLGCPSWNLETIAEKALEYGFQGVELRAKGTQHVDTDMKLQERKEVKRLFTAKGIEICCLDGYSTFCSSRKDELEKNKQKLLDYIDLASDLEAPFVRTFIGNYSSLLSEDDVAGNAAQYIAECGHVAETKGITVLIETHDSFDTGKKVLNILKRIKNSGVGVLWDIHHPIRAGESIDETYSLVGSYIKHVHLKDELNNKLCITGKGTLPIKQVVELLEKKGYDGYLSLEWEKMWVKELEEPEIAFPAYIEYLKALI